MTQPPLGGPTPPPDGPQEPGQPEYGQPAYPPAVDPYAAPGDGDPAPGAGYPPAAGGYPAGDAFTAPAGGHHADFPPPDQPFAAYPTSDPAAPPYPGQPFPAGQPGHPYQPAHPGFPPYSPGAAPRKKRGLIIGGILALVLLLCTGGGVSAWLLLRNMESGEGAAEPAAAVSDFMEAVYAQKDAAKAAGLVCSEARDDAEIAGKVAEIREYEQKYESPRFEWDDPAVGDRTEERAIVTVQLRMTTADEKTAEQQLKFTVVRKTGWWVCDVA